MAAPSITCVKQLAESPHLSSIPSNYIYYSNSSTETTASDPQDSIPIIDLSLLTSDNTDHKAKAIQDLDKACQEWGFFMVVNHGIPEELMRGMLEATSEFFNLLEEEKPEFQPKNVLSPIRGLLLEYCERIRGVVSKLLKGISESLGIAETEMEKALNLNSSLQIFAANFYPRCPNPDMALGMPPHSDHGLFTILIQNEVGGLQIQHQGRWFYVNALPNSILVNTGDHLEIFSNGKYKSVLHRAVVNNEKTRISIALANGPSLDTVVSPALQLVQTQGCIPAYVPMKYKDYLSAQQNNRLNGKSILKSLQVQD